MSRLRIVVAAFVASALVASPRIAAAQALPSAKELMAKHDELTGGYAALVKHSSIKQVGTMTIPAAGMDATLEIYKDKSGKFLQKMTLGAMGEVAAGYDGNVVWASQMGNAMILEGDQAKALRAQNDFFSGTHDAAKYKSAETVELADFDGRKCYRVKMVLLDGTETTEYFDQATGLLAGATRDVDSPAGKMTATQTLRDYKDFDGLKIATTANVTSAQADATMHVTSVEFDKVDPAVFALPAGVKAMVKPAP